jgi:hypothetical protein
MNVYGKKLFEVVRSGLRWFEIVRSKPAKSNDFKRHQTISNDIKRFQTITQRDFGAWVSETQFAKFSFGAQK